jgi:peptide/nickel transport system permease protein
MILYIVRRIGQSVLLLLAMSMIVFVAVYAIGDPVEILVSPQATQAEIAATRTALGLDKPLVEQYRLFLVHALHGDLGRSFIFHEPALSLVVSRMGATMELAGVALLVASGIGIGLGLMAAWHVDGWLGRSIMAGSILGLSLPSFWVGILMLLCFTLWLGWFPAIGRGQTADFLGIHSSLFTLDGWRHIALPAATLALGNAAFTIRFTRSSAVDVLQSEFIKYAHARGIAPGRILRVHVLRAVLIPLITVIGIEFGTLIAFSVVTESIFAWPGMGKLIIDSINVLDRPVIVAYLMLIVVLFVAINLVVDLLYRLLDPRVGGDRG